MELAGIIEAIVNDIAETTANRVMARMEAMKTDMGQTTAAPTETEPKTTAKPKTTKGSPKKTEAKVAEPEVEAEDYPVAEENLTTGEEEIEQDDRTPADFVMQLVENKGQEVAMATLKEAGGERLSALDAEQLVTFIALAKKALGE